MRAENDDIEWTLVDLDRGTAKVLDALKGYPFPYAPYVHGVRWLTFYPSDQSIVEPGSSMLGLDLESGTVKTLLTFDFDEPYAGIFASSTFGSSADGRFVAVNDFGEEYPRFWLLDAQEGKATLYDGRIASAFSPDGQQLMVGEPAGADKRVWHTLIMTVDGRDVRTLAESFGRGGVWVPSQYSR